MISSFILFCVFLNIWYEEQTFYLFQVLRSLVVSQKLKYILHWQICHLIWHYCANIFHKVKMFIFLLYFDPKYECEWVNKVVWILKYIFVKTYFIVYPLAIILFSFFSSEALGSQMDVRLSVFSTSKVVLSIFQSEPLNFSLVRRLYYEDNILYFVRHKAKQGREF